MPAPPRFVSDSRNPDGELSKTYGHLLPDSGDRARVALDAFLN